MSKFQEFETELLSLGRHVKLTEPTKAGKWAGWRWAEGAPDKQALKGLLAKYADAVENQEVVMSLISGYGTLWAVQYKQR